MRRWFADLARGNPLHVAEITAFSYVVPDRLDELVAMRAELRRWLAVAGVENDAAEEVVLACWEVCANAVEHAVDSNGPVTLVASTTTLGVRVAVNDTGRWRDIVPRSDRGLGLNLARTLMDRVSILRDRPGTEVVMWRFTGGRA